MEYESPHAVSDIGLVLLALELCLCMLWGGLK